ncbi:hypothetical protein DER29_2609 [Micromonospora sp. M71_S20]|uniref:hypothetical protein n=1 Tax=Micromonospora sp. M71_S20 TaxID=592872 RepID=UPI000EB53FE0|nr:hypothetical protein [Micromonospora sp. M71_S20]RLK24684.1 hypothetical protein DER29_2609 [Micromonospora sp. M71_S20]
MLSPAALVMLIILRVQAGAKDPDTEEVRIVPDYAGKAFLLSEETRTRGLRELQHAGLISVRRRQLVATDSFDFRRFRKRLPTQPSGPRAAGDDSRALEGGA